MSLDSVSSEEKAKLKQLVKKDVQNYKK